MKTRTIQALAMGVLMSLLTSAPQASAAILAEGELNKVFFAGFENLFDSAGNFKAPTIAGLAVGDHLAGVIKVQNVTAGPGPDVSNNALTGIFATRIESITTHGPVLHLTFGPAQVTNFCNGADCWSIAGKLTGQEQFAFYLEQGTSPFVEGTSMAQSVAAATDGGLYLTLGYNPGVDGIYGTPDDNGYNYGHPITDPSGQPKGESFGGLNVYQNNSGFLFNKINDPSEFEANQSVDLYFTSEFEFNDNLSSPWKTAINDPAVVHPFIPEPSSFGLLSLGLMGLGFVRTRRS